MEDTRTEEQKRQNHLEYLIMTFCENGELDKVKDFIIKHPEIDITIGGNYCLSMACKKNKLNVVKYLIENTIYSEKTDIYLNNNGFVLASDEGHLNIVKYLFEHWKNNPKLRTQQSEIDRSLIEQK